MLVTLLFVGIAYALGSINSAIIVCQAMKLPDPRTDGSKNPGATNVLRLSGKMPAIIVLAADLAKGLIAVWLAKLFGIDGFGAGLVALAAVAGHVFPVFYEFQGGKGVATTIGALYGLSFLMGLLCTGIWIGVARFYGYSSLASLCTIGAAVLLTLLTGHFSMVLPMLALAGLVAYKHLDNIQRLQAGTESKINWGSSDISDKLP